MVMAISVLVQASGAGFSAGGGPLGGERRPDHGRKRSTRLRARKSKEEKATGGQHRRGA
jgi:hypothetical protein